MADNSGLFRGSLNRVIPDWENSPPPDGRLGTIALLQVEAPEVQP